MQKMPASLAGLAGPPVVRAPAAAPVTTMVRAASAVVKAPPVRWPQLRKPVAAVQLAFDVHGTGKHGGEPAPHCAQGTPMGHVQLVPEAEPLHLRANVLRDLFRQKPQKM